jgi:hypothetical protein
MVDIGTDSPIAIERIAWEGKDENRVQVIESGVSVVPFLDAET